MKKLFFFSLLCLSATQLVLVSCSNKSPSAEDYDEGTDYIVFKRVRLLDETGFDQPVEAFSLLLPKGWKHEGEIKWNGPGTSCDGTSSWFKATSKDGEYSFEIFPNASYTNDQAQFQTNENNAGSSNCGYMEPLEAEEYLRKVFGPKELGKPKIVKLQANEDVVDLMKQSNETSAREMQQYGAGQINFNQTALNATVRWTDGEEGFVVLGVSIMEGGVPNGYDGTISKISITTIKQGIVFKYPKGESENAKNQFSFIMSSIRTNMAWKNAVSKYWISIRQQKNALHRKRIEMTDELTRSMGEQTIRRGNERLKAMDMDLRNWEMNQSSQDRIHTNFIKSIREVENFQDETGKYEMTSSYDHAWSRGDGKTFVMSNNPNFDPQFVFQDQSWKEMKKVD